MCVSLCVCVCCALCTLERKTASVGAWCCTATEQPVPLGWQQHIPFAFDVEWWMMIFFRQHCAECSLSFTMEREGCREGGEWKEERCRFWQPSNCWYFGCGFRTYKFMYMWILIAQPLPRAIMSAWLCIVDAAAAVLPVTTYTLTSRTNLFLQLFRRYLQFNASTMYSHLAHTHSTRYCTLWKTNKKNAYRFCALLSECVTCDAAAAI